MDAKEFERELMADFSGREGGVMSYKEFWNNAVPELAELHKSIKLLQAEIKRLQIENKRLTDTLILLSNSTFYSNIPTDTEFTYASYYNQIDTCMEGQQLKNGDE